MSLSALVSTNDVLVTVCSSLEQKLRKSYCCHTGAGYVVASALASGLDVLVKVF